MIEEKVFVQNGSQAESLGTVRPGTFDTDVERIAYMTARTLASKAFGVTTVGFVLSKCIEIWRSGGHLKSRY